MANPKDDIAFARVVNVPPAASARRRSTTCPSGPGRSGSRCWPWPARRPAVPGLKDRAARSLRDFGLLMDELTALRDHSAEEVIRKLLTLTGYRDYLAADSKGAGEDRLANLDELVSAAPRVRPRAPGGDRR